MSIESSGDAIVGWGCLGSRSKGSVWLVRNILLFQPQQETEAADTTSSHYSVNFIAPKDGAVDLALRLAKTMTDQCSPDAVQATLRAMRITLETGDAAEGAVVGQEESAENKRCLEGENIKVCVHFN